MSIKKDLIEYEEPQIEIVILENECKILNGAVGGEDILYGGDF